MACRGSKAYIRVRPACRDRPQAQRLRSALTPQRLPGQVALTRASMPA